VLTNAHFSEPLILGVDIGYGNVKVYGSQHRGIDLPQQFAGMSPPIAPHALY